LIQPVNARAASPGADQSGVAKAGARRLLRFAPLLVLVVVATAAIAGGALGRLTPSALAEHRADWAATAQAHPVETLTLYVLAYAALTGAGLPVAMMLTLTGGLVFGTLEGGLATAAAGTLAAAASYAAARYAFADLLEAQLARRPRLERRVKGLRRRGFWYLLSARLMPMMPFPLVNVASGIARLPLPTYLGATVAGALPSSFLYAQLGSGLGQSLAAGRLRAALAAPAVWGPLVGLAVLSLVPALLQRKA
jgi:uncharacterized membrane protein YdjX (TVP38/TMEM64 family)